MVYWLVQAWIARAVIQPRDEHGADYHAVRYQRREHLEDVMRMHRSRVFLSWIRARAPEGGEQLTYLTKN